MFQKISESCKYVESDSICSMPPCSLVTAASQQPYARYGSKKSEFIYPGTAHGTAQVLLLDFIRKAIMEARKPPESQV